MITQKLYEQNSHLISHFAHVISCTQRDDVYEILLDKSCLFPTAGGQPNDLGSLNDIPVIDVTEKNGEPVILTKTALPAGQDVTVRLDWKRRFDFMQQHTGEHLFSYVLYRDLGLHNVGFHLAENYATIDMDAPVSKEALDKAVLAVNELIWQDLSVSTAIFENEEELENSGFSLRKHAKGLVPPIRIVSIKNADACTCCAPHCTGTGEIGCLLVTDCIPWKGGSRITFLCGNRAVKHAMRTHASLDAIARSFSIKREDTENAVRRQGEALSAAKYRIGKLSEELNVFLSEKLRTNGTRVGKYLLCESTFDGMDAKQLSDLGSRIVSEESTFCLLLNTETEKTAYHISHSNNFPIDAGELAGILNAMTGGKGGGRKGRAQGTIPGKVPPETSGQFIAYLKARLEK